jgi:hypothetical protein
MNTTLNIATALYPQIHGQSHVTLLAPRFPDDLSCPAPSYNLQPQHNDAAPITSAPIRLALYRLTSLFKL